MAEFDAIIITYISGEPTPSGRTDRYRVSTIHGGTDGRPYMFHVTRLVAEACGYRYNADKDTLSVGGYGFDKRDDIKDGIRTHAERLAEAGHCAALTADFFRTAEVLFN